MLLGCHLYSSTVSYQCLSWSSWASIWPSVSPHPTHTFTLYIHTFLTKQVDYHVFSFLVNLRLAIPFLRVYRRFQITAFLTCAHISDFKNFIKRIPAEFSRTRTVSKSRAEGEVTCVAHILLHQVWTFSFLPAAFSDGVFAIVATLIVLDLT